MKLSLADLAPSKREGYLEKKGAGSTLFGRRNWNRRFVVLDGPPGETSGTVAIGGGQYTCAITEEVVECSDGLADTVTLPRVDLPKLPE